MNTTQQHLAISDISNDILILKDGGGALVLQVSAVNFGLLSDREQMAIIYSFAQMLNSLSFTIQIAIISERLNISSYLTLLDKAQKAQTNPLLSRLISEYKDFIGSTVKENEVLDKQFYMVIPLFGLEVGLTVSKINLEQKIKTILLPRRDQVIRQLGRIGLKATQLSRRKLIEVFYSIYNGAIIDKPASQPINPAELAVRLKNPVDQTSTREESPPTTSTTFSTSPLGTSKPASQVSSSMPPAGQSSKTHPFVVEELEE